MNWSGRGPRRRPWALAAQFSVRRTTERRDRAAGGRRSPREDDVSGKITVASAEHYTWGSRCEGGHLVRQPELSVIRERMPGETSEVRHFHQHARQFFFVLAGTAVLEVDGAELSLAAGEGCEVVAGTPHQMFNRSQADLEFLVVSQPPSHGDRILSGPTEGSRND